MHEGESPLDVERLDVDVRRALEWSREAPAASVLFHALLLAHGRPESLDRQQAAALLAALLFAPQTLAAGVEERVIALYPPLAAAEPWRRAQLALPILEALYYPEQQATEAAWEGLLASASLSPDGPTDP